ncbi:hypothetical protein EJB05_45736, partial [Eragrostis curvula]
MPSMSSGTKRSFDNVEAIKLSEIRSFPKSYSTRHSTKLFMTVVKKLSPEQRQSLVNVGFGKLLDISCSFTPKSLVSWIISQFDCSTRSLRFANGYSFHLNPYAVHKVFGVPIGGSKIELKTSDEASKFIKMETKCDGDSPTIKELVTLITTELSGDSFVRVFLLFALSTLFCPTSHSKASSKYFSPLIQVDKIKSYDWSELILEWLIEYIKRYQDKISSGKSCVLGGCTFFLVICYLQFLNVPELSIVATNQDLSFWTTSAVGYVTSRDLVSGFPPIYGKLHVKHILSTPFRDMASPSMNSNCKPQITEIASSDTREATRRKLSELTDTFNASVLDLIKPVVSNYASQYINILMSEEIRSSQALADNINSVVNELPFHSNSFLEYDHDENEATLTDLSESDDENYFSPKRNVTKLDVVPKCNMPLATDSVMSDASEKEPLMVMRELRFFPPKIEDSFVHPIEELFSKLMLECPVELSLDLVLPSALTSIEDYVSSEIKFFPIPEKPQESVSLLSLAMQDDHFDQKLEKHVENPLLIQKSSQNVSLAEQCLEQSSSCINSIESPPNTYGNGNCAFNHKTSTVSLFMKTVGFRTDNPIGDKYIHDTMSMEEFYQEKIIDELATGFRNCSQMIEQEAKVSFESKPTTSNDKVKSEAVIFATGAEKFFYDSFTSNVPRTGPSEHIFQLENIWVDKRTLALSMRSGCWFHKYVMNCFCKMYNFEQEQRLKFRQRHPGEITKFFFLSDIAELLMKRLIHTDIKDCFTVRRIGVVLENVDYVFIPCSVNNQWFVVVVNFMAKRFDVLNSEPACTTGPQIDNVIYNFQNLFIMAFQRSEKFDIREFETNYIDVPKQNFRYDSGIFDVQFMQTYNGTSVQKFGNGDLIELRAKLLFQLLSFKDN